MLMLVECVTTYTLTPPKHTQRIQGDGNCLFRALCCAITGIRQGTRPFAKLFVTTFAREPHTLV